MVCKRILRQRRQNVATLQDCAGPGYVVTYDPDCHSYAVARYGTMRAFGRFHVVMAWLSGYAAACADFDDGDEWDTIGRFS